MHAGQGRNDESVQKSEDDTKIGQTHQDRSIQRHHSTSLHTTNQAKEDTIQLSTPPAPQYHDPAQQLSYHFSVPRPAVFSSGD